MNRFILILLTLCLSLVPVTGQGGLPTLTFMWQASPATESVTSYRVYQRVGVTAPYTYVKWVDAAAGQSSFVSQNVPAGVYTFVLRTVNSVGESVDGNPVNITVPGLPSQNNTLNVSFSIK